MFTIPDELAIVVGRIVIDGIILITVIAIVVRFINLLGYQLPWQKNQNQIIAEYEQRIKELDRKMKGKENG